MSDEPAYYRIVTPAGPLARHYRTREEAEAVRAQLDGDGEYAVAAYNSVGKLVATPEGP